MAIPAAAGTLDLTAGGSGSIGSATFVTTDLQPTGTGVLMPFVRIQNNVMEMGFNTDASPGSGDLADVKAGTWTHSVLVSSMTGVTYNGVPSYRFVLDINQANSKPLLSIDELRIYTAPSANISSLATLSAQNLIYDMGAGNDVYLDYSLNNGSGSGDLFCYLPVSLFTGQETQYMYLYSKMGATGGSYASNDGFEEWAFFEEAVPTEKSSWGVIKSLYAK